MNDIEDKIAELQALVNTLKNELVNLYGPEVNAALIIEYKNATSISFMSVDTPRAECLNALLDPLLLASDLAQGALEELGNLRPLKLDS
jgi:hypothetical protein